MYTPFFSKFIKYGIYYIKNGEYMGRILNNLIENYPIITMHGTKELYIENFTLILSLNETLTKIRAGKEIIEITGENLSIEYMNKDDIKLYGNIKYIKLTEVS